MVNTKGFNPWTGEWNDSLTGDFIWNNANIGEALSCVVTPYTWSIIGKAYDYMNVLPGYHVAGNIGGRPYQNGSVMVSALKAIGKDMDAMFEEMSGVDEIPEGLTIPIIPVSWRDRLLIMYKGVRLQFRERAALRDLLRFLDENQKWCASMRHRARAAATAQDLLDLWPESVAQGAAAFWAVVGTAWRYAEALSPLRHELTSLVGETDASDLLSSVSSESELLASLGPLVGLSRVARGELSRHDYLEQYGHRGTHETEFAVPRPAEDPDWLDQQLDLFSESSASVEAMLDQQRAQFDAAWIRFKKSYPDQASSMQHRLNDAAQISRAREAVRSELTRQIWAGRIWALRAGELTGLGDDLFYLIDAEVLDLLAGKPAPVETLPARRETFDRYRDLPPYPPVISGQFDPFTWAADPNRQSYIYDSHVPHVPQPSGAEPSRIIKGYPGAAGRVEGLVRRIDSPQEGDQLLPGEILVTSQTNIGWTLLFPRLAAVVTDVGAPLSHAAIVARELGIPAVVACGNATTLLKTGDRVRVDGATGIVELLEGS